MNWKLMRRLKRDVLGYQVTKKEITMRIIDPHLTGLNTLQARLDSGAMVGLSVCYDKLSPEDAATVVMENPDKRDRLLINSEFGWGGEGYFSVPRSVLSMRKKGLKRDEIEQVTWENPKRFFNLEID